MKNNSDIKVMLKEAGILFAITLIAGLVLGFVYELTKEPIEVQRQKAVQKACAAVFSEASEFQELSYTVDDTLAASLAEDGVTIGTVYKALNADKAVLGYVLQATSSEGYGGNIVLYMGVTLDGVLNDISLLEISETPGLGMQAEKV
ncbi:MAG: FMN-binding protein, partial [Acetatifactor sp.]